MGPPALLREATPTRLLTLFRQVDKFRLLDLTIVTVDLAAIFIETASDNEEASGMRFAKGGRLLRMARLARFARALRTLRLAQVGRTT